MKLNNITISTFVMNLEERQDRRKHIENEFAGRAEFDLHIVPAIKSERGADGLWKTFFSIVEEANKGDDDVIIICEDDHKFTPDYERDSFLRDVITASELGCQLLWGGIGNFSAVVPLNERLLWVDWAWCDQFTILFRSAFEKILNSHFVWGKDEADNFLSTIIPNKMVLFPAISIQQEFGYSDVTDYNKKPGRVTAYMTETSERLKQCMEISKRYKAFCIQ